MHILTCTHLQVLWHHRHSMTDRCTHFSIEWGVGGGAWTHACKFGQIHRIWQILPNLCELVQFCANLAFGIIIPLWLLTQEEGQAYANLCKFTPWLSNSWNIQSQHNWTDLCKPMQMTANVVISLTTWDTGPLMLGRQSLAACKSKPTVRGLWKFMQISTNLRQIFGHLYENVLYDISPTANTCQFSPTLWKFMQIWKNLPNLCLSCKSIQMRPHGTVVIDNCTYCPTWNSINPHQGCQIYANLMHIYSDLYKPANLCSFMQMHPMASS